jgi:2-keto-4-pentenoate hydratase/2-oxohepta-3-ene-1,7-dioic acid hydratase in catechol pathway
MIGRRSKAISIMFPALLFASELAAQPTTRISDRPETPFKLATFEANGKQRIGLVMGSRVLDITRANSYLAQKTGLAPLRLPDEMRVLIKQYGAASKRLYQIANYFADEHKTAGLAFAYDFAKVSVKAPIKYPWNLLNLAANYKAHAEGMGAADAQNGRGFDASAASRIDPDRDGPIVFAKSPRSCIIDPGEAYLIPPGRTRIDWEGELAIVMGKQSYMISKENAHDAVFGYSAAARM